jgi:integrase
VLDVFSRVLDFGVRASLLARNPARGIDRPKIEAPRIRSLSAEQARKLLGKAREGEAWVEAAVALGLCGLRLGETFGLTWGDIDLRSGRVRVRQAVAELQDGTRQIGPLKTKSARRELALPAWAAAALKRHRRSLGATPHPGRLVFLTAAGSPIRMSNFRRRDFDPLVKGAELVGTTYHSLRHTAATLLLAAGADVKSAQRILGHAKASHTLDLYADFVPDRVDEAMGRLDEALRARRERVASL